MRTLTLITMLSVSTGCASFEPRTEAAQGMENASAQNSAQRTLSVANSAVSASTSAERIDNLRAFASALIDDPAAETVLTQAVSRNADLAVAATRIEQARAERRASAAERWPSLDLTLSATRSRAALADVRVDAGGSDTQRNSTRWSGGLNAAWTPDLTGKQSSALQASTFRLQAEVAREAAVRLGLLSDTATALVDVRNFDARIALAEEAVRLDQELAEITTAKRRGGQVSEAEVLRAVGQTDTSRALLASLQRQRADAIKQLGTLLGMRVDEVSQLLKPAVSTRWLARAETLSLPSALLLRRPDVIEADRRLDAAGSDLREAVRARYPEFSLIGTLGWVAGTFSGLSGADALTASLAPQISWSFLDFGRRAADVDRRNAQQREAVLRYEEIVNTAFVEAESALRALAALEAQTLAAEKAERAQTDAAALTLLQYRAGISDFGTALDARRTANTAADASASARADASRGYIAWLNATGGASETDRSQ
jgi:NodT family efflux transporter outer membrane factor (OMF) lipoprotein